MSAKAQEIITRQGGFLTDYHNEMTLFSNAYRCVFVDVFSRLLVREMLAIKNSIRKKSRREFESWLKMFFQVERKQTTEMLEPIINAFAGQIEWLSKVYDRKFIPLSSTKDAVSKIANDYINTRFETVWPSDRSTLIDLLNNQLKDSARCQGEIAMTRIVEYITGETDIMEVNGNGQNTESN
jgi:hypothetical protein